MKMRILSVVLLIAACSGKKSEEKADDAVSPPAATPPSFEPPASFEPGKPAASSPTAGGLNATQRTVGIIHRNQKALGACKPAGLGSTMINLHIAGDGKVTFDLMTKEPVGDDVKQCVGVALEKISFPSEKVAFGCRWNV